MTQSGNGHAVNVSTGERTYTCRLEHAGPQRWLVLSEMVVTDDGGLQRVGEMRVEVDQIGALARSFEEAATFLSQYAVVAEAATETDQSPATIRSRLLQHGLIEDFSQGADAGASFAAARNGSL